MMWSALLCPALPCSARLCYSLLWLVGPHVWIPKLAGEASVVCFVVILPRPWRVPRAGTEAMFADMVLVLLV